MQKFFDVSSMDFPVNTPKPPYYAVTFTNILSENSEGYEATAERMVELAKQQTGFLGIESVRDENGNGIATSYWKDMASIANWKQQEEHLIAQTKGKSTWYKSYHVRISKVERAYTKP